MLNVIKTWLCVSILCLLGIGGTAPGQEKTAEKPEQHPLVEVTTKAPNNKKLKIRYRVPRGYDAARQKQYRVMVAFGGRNFEGIGAKGLLNDPRFHTWADKHEIFIVFPAYKDDDYWVPKQWSGKAMLEGLALIKKKYNICTDHLLYYGYSAGGQCSNLFAAWKPQLVRAWAAYGTGVMHEPSFQMKGIPGVLTCGDADTRYSISKRYLALYRKAGERIVWKTIPNQPHSPVPSQVHTLSLAVLAHYHKMYERELEGKPVYVKEEQVEFIGDDALGEYYPVGSPQARNVVEEDRVELYSKEIAEAWARTDV